MRYARNESKIISNHETNEQQKSKYKPTPIKSSRKLSINQEITETPMMKAESQGTKVFENKFLDI